MTIVFMNSHQLWLVICTVSNQSKIPAWMGEEALRPTLGKADIGSWHLLREGVSLPFANMVWGR